MLKLVTRLVPPHGDKSWSFQAIHLKPEQRNQLVAAMKDPKVEPCKPFKQGDSGNWLMIEFWTENLEAIKVAAKHLAGLLNSELSEGDFTRAEVLEK